MKLKAFRIAIIVATFFISGFLCLSMVSALGSNEATASVRWSKTSPQPGDTVTITLSFENKLQKQIQIARIGINGDWIPPDSGGNPQFVGPQYVSSPVTVAAGETFTSETYSIAIPSTIRAGIHTYYVAVDGYDSTGSGFSWDSPQFSITIGDASTVSSTPGPSSTNSEPNNNSSLETSTIIAIITVTGIVAVIAIALFMSRRNKQPAPVFANQPPNNQPPNNQPWPSAPKEEKDDEYEAVAEEEEESSESQQQNFDI
jgi:hypothetical protein